ncbi:hypothetical protein PRZ48_002514 [Zasmidium cellare]|uniref:Uncharacterized protein n=1 Tax=Zasmidium cellare TaxID=395010 RepID=A0ABR0F527_ZASCE|nr:hypothetical protein PRZ48_002514 [Zasmidium cellare]
MSNNNTSPKQTSTPSDKSSPSQPSNQNTSTQDPTTTPPPPDSDLTAEPEEITHSDAHERFSFVIPKKGLPLPEELEQNGKPTGQPQHVQKTMAEFAEDFDRKYGVHGSGVRAPRKESGGGDGERKKGDEEGKGGEEGGNGFKGE